jgi:nicotinate-nucleotide adenylyltransferase
MNNEKIIVVYGGSFNPVHNGHIRYAEIVLELCPKVEKVIFVPVNKKYNKSDLIENEHRLNMLKLVCEKHPKFEVIDVEMRDRQLYMFETLKLLKDQYKEYDIWFMIGSDNLKELHTWKYPEELVSKYKIIVMDRKKDNIEEIINNDKFLFDNRDAFIKLDRTKQIDLSSTEVRNKIKNGEDFNELVPLDVADYIKQYGLYK